MHDLAYLILPHSPGTAVHAATGAACPTLQHPDEGLLMHATTVVALAALEPEQLGGQRLSRV